MLKAEENPPILYPEAESLGELEGPWWVAWTKSRHEKALAWWLGQHEVGYFLPLREKKHQRAGRKYRTVVPLFGGYVFFCGDEEARLAALKSNRIASVLEVVEQERLVRELQQIYDALSRGAELDPHPYLKAGQRCRVTGGALIGLEGILQQKKTGTRLILQIDMLGQAAALEVDADLVEAIE